MVAPEAEVQVQMIIQGHILRIAVHSVHKLAKRKLHHFHLLTVHSLGLMEVRQVLGGIRAAAVVQEALDLIHLQREASVERTLFWEQITTGLVVAVVLVGLE
jgi:hypothetical protein